jgi:hypothetical protein
MIDDGANNLLAAKSPQPEREDNEKTADQQKVYLFNNKTILMALLLIGNLEKLQRDTPLNTIL